MNEETGRPLTVKEIDGSNGSVDVNPSFFSEVMVKQFFILREKQLYICWGRIDRLFTVGFEGGVTLTHKGRSICFDSANDTVTSSVRCVSHAHSDHVAKFGKIIATQATVELMRLVWGIEGFRFKTIEYGGLLRLEDSFSVKALNAGHVLGSATFNIKGDGLDLTYTGDINTVETLTTQPAEINQSETLVIESTYGHSEFVFPPREQIYARIVKWATTCLNEGVIPAFKAYSIGKAQELIKLFNIYTTIPVVVGPTVSKASRVYVEHGEKLDYFVSGTFEGARLLASGKCVYIDSQMRRTMTYRRVKWAVATGLALRYKYDLVDAAFPLSSHADFKMLTEYVENAEPKKVYVYHGYSEYFAKFLRRKGFDAEPLTPSL